MVQSIHVGKGLPTAGFVVEMDEYVVYHAGDTALFDEMKRIGTDFSVDLACVPIGDRFTMGTRDAARAVELVRPRHVVPIHYNTFPEIVQDPEEFRLLVGEASEVAVLKPGEEFLLDRRRIP